MINNKKGITLIALVITIIVMLILVIVTVNIAVNGGLFNKAKKGSSDTEMHAIYETIISSAGYNNDGNINVLETKEKAIENLQSERKEAKSIYCFPDENNPKIIVLEVKGKTGTYYYEIKDLSIKILEEITDEEGTKKLVGGDDIYTVIKDGENISLDVIYKITYVLDGGIYPEEQIQTAKKGETISLSEPTKENYIFKGWYFESDFSGETITEITNIQKDTTVYVKWEEEPIVDFYTSFPSNVPDYKSLVSKKHYISLYSPWFPGYLVGVIDTKGNVEFATRTFTSGYNTTYVRCDEPYTVTLYTTRRDQWASGSSSQVIPGWYYQATTYSVAANQIVRLLYHQNTKVTYYDTTDNIYRTYNETAFDLTKIEVPKNRDVGRFVE